MIISLFSTGDELFAEVMRRTGIDPNAQAAARPANGMPKLNLIKSKKFNRSCDEVCRLTLHELPRLRQISR